MFDKSPRRTSDQVCSASSAATRTPARLPRQRLGDTRHTSITTRHCLGHRPAYSDTGSGKPGRDQPSSAAISITRQQARATRSPRPRSDPATQSDPASAQTRSGPLFDPTRPILTRFKKKKIKKFKISKFFKFFNFDQLRPSKPRQRPVLPEQSPTTTYFARATSICSP